jgi:hypothetical protein
MPAGSGMNNDTFMQLFILDPLFVGGASKMQAGKYGESTPLRQRGGGGFGHPLTHWAAALKQRVARSDGSGGYFRKQRPHSGGSTVARWSKSFFTRSAKKIDWHVQKASACY